MEGTDACQRTDNSLESLQRSPLMWRAYRRREQLERQPFTAAVEVAFFETFVQLPLCTVWSGAARLQSLFHVWSSLGQNHFDQTVLKVRRLLQEAGSDQRRRCEIKLWSWSTWLAVPGVEPLESGPFNMAATITQWVWEMLRRTLEWWELWLIINKYLKQPYSLLQISCYNITINC